MKDLLRRALRESRSPSGDAEGAHDGKPAAHRPSRKVPQNAFQFVGVIVDAVGFGSGKVTGFCGAGGGMTRPPDESIVIVGGTWLGVTVRGAPGDGVLNSAAN